MHLTIRRSTEQFDHLVQFAAEKSFGVLVPREKAPLQIEGSGNTSLVLKVAVQNTRSSFVLLDMCGCKARYIKDTRSPGKKPQNVEPAEAAVLGLLQYLSRQGTEKSDGIPALYRDLLSNRRLQLMLHVAAEVPLAQIQPVLNAIEKYVEVSRD